MRGGKENKRIVILSSNGNDKNTYIKYKKFCEQSTKNDNTIYVMTEGKSDAEYLKKIFSSNLNYYMKINKKTKNDLTDDLKIKYSTIRDWTSGAKYPRPDKINVLANYFNIMRSDLTEKKADNKVPVLGKIPAGIPIEAIEDILDYEEIPQSWLTGDKQYFALKIEGRSMYPMYCSRRYCYI